jgi:hypothetical protein
MDTNISIHRVNMKEFCIITPVPLSLLDTVKMKRTGVQPHWIY